MEAFRPTRHDDALDLEVFEAGLHGSIVFPGSPEYDTARQVNSARADKRPALIVRAADAADVARTVNLARESGLAAVRPRRRPQPRGLRHQRRRDRARPRRR